MKIFGRAVARETWIPIAAFIGVLLAVAVIAECAAVDTQEISATTWFGFEGPKGTVEVATYTADVTYKVQIKVSGTWADIQPDSSSPDDVFTVWAGMSDKWSWQNGMSGIDSTRVVVTPASTTYVTVRMQ